MAGEVGEGRDEGKGRAGGRGRRGETGMGRGGEGTEAKRTSLKTSKRFVSIPLRGLLLNLLEVLCQALRGEW